MGCGGGTYIFDVVVGALYGARVTKEQFQAIIIDLDGELKSQDWNSLCESAYYDDLQIKDIFDL